MNYTEKEWRSFSESAEPQIRNAGEAEGESRNITGYAVVFGKRSVVMSSWGGRFEEIIHPEAITQELLERSDVKALMEHNPERLLARSKQGKGTLKLSLDNVGLRYEFEAPRTADGDTALELVRRGDLAGSSFAFTARSEGAIEERWDAERKIWVYEVRKIDGLYDVTITSNPAYQQTSVEARSLEAPQPADKVQLQDYYDRIHNL